MARQEAIPRAIDMKMPPLAKTWTNTRRTTSKKFAAKPPEGEAAPGQRPAAWMYCKATASGSSGRV